MDSRNLNAPSGPLIVSPREKGTIWFSLVVPTYNEKQNVEPLVTQVANVLDGAFSGKYEIIFVDDDSPDGTASCVNQVALRFSQVKLMVRDGERGLSTAVVRGWQAAQGEILGVIDGDLQHPVSVLSDVLAKIKDGADLVFASRYTREGGLGSWGLARKLASQSATLLSLIVLPEKTSKISDPMSGCFAFRRDVIAGIALEPKGYKILLEVLARGRAKVIDDVSYTFQLRQHGVTKVTWRQSLEYLEQLIKLRVFLWKQLFKF